MRHRGPLENLTLTQSELQGCRPISGEGGSAVRAYCPFHGSDKQRSLRVKMDTGRFQCFACGAWGYMDWAREEWLRERKREGPSHRRGGLRSVPERKGPSRVLKLESSTSRSASPFGKKEKKKESVSSLDSAELESLLKDYQEALRGSYGERYLRSRGIPADLAEKYGLGYAAPGTWPQDKGRQGFAWGRVVFPHTDPSGQIVNLYGRAIEVNEQAPKSLKHRHLSGAKGYFNACVLMDGAAPVFVCEGAFDALSLVAAGFPRALAIFGVHGWRWEWARGVKELIFAMDADEGGEAWKKLARLACLRGKRVRFLPAEAYGGEKDPSAAWVAGVLRIQR